MNIDFFQKQNIEKPTFKQEVLMKQNDLSLEQADRHIKINLKDVEEAKMIVVFGASGSGKTSIAREAFGEPYVLKNEDKSVIDSLDLDVNTTQKYLSKSGFGSLPSMLKKVSTLSNGEKFRVMLAQAMSDESENKIIIDEFTSVVDIETAKSMSILISKFSKKTDKQIILITPRIEILDYLEYDYLIDTNNMTAEKVTPCRSTQEIEIREVGKEYWELFRHFHYMNTEKINGLTACYGAFINNQIVGFIAYRHIPSNIKNLEMVSRLVVLPTFSGIGIGYNLLNITSEIRKDCGHEISMITSSKKEAESLKRNSLFRQTRQGLPAKDKKRKVRRSVKSYAFMFK